MSETAPLRVHQRRVGFPYFFFLLFIGASIIFPLAAMKYGTRTVPDAKIQWILVSLLTGGVFVYELLQHRKLLRFEITQTDVAFNTLYTPMRRLPFAEIEAFEYHPASRAQSALVIKLKKNAGQSYWTTSDNPVLTDPYGVSMRVLQAELAQALAHYNARST